MKLDFPDFHSHITLTFLWSCPQGKQLEISMGGPMTEPGSQTETLENSYLSKTSALNQAELGNFK